MANIIYDSSLTDELLESWKQKYEEALKQQIVDKPKNGAISIGEVQIKDGKFFFVTEEATYELESIDQIKKIATKKLLKKKADSSDKPYRTQYPNKSEVKNNWTDFHTKTLK